MITRSTILGTLVVTPIGRTTLEKEYILKTVLSHLPIVNSGGNDMQVYINSCNTNTTICTHNEFGQDCSYQTSKYPDGWMKTTEEFTLTLYGNLKDKTCRETNKDFLKWICRLAKRVMVNSVIVNISDNNSEDNFTYNYTKNTNNCFSDMFEYSDSESEPNWCDYLLWDKGICTDYPMLLEYKYFNNTKNDKECERRLNAYKHKEEE